MAVDFLDMLQSWGTHLGMTHTTMLTCRQSGEGRGGEGGEGRLLSLKAVHNQCMLSCVEAEFECQCPNLLSYLGQSALPTQNLPCMQTGRNRSQNSHLGCFVVEYITLDPSALAPSGLCQAVNHPDSHADKHCNSAFEPYSNPVMTDHTVASCTQVVGCPLSTQPCSYL